MVSIIVPVYNAEDYLDICLESLVGQTYADIEILVIDDCSTDNSLKKCDEWAEKDARVKVISLYKNRGPAAARNEGLKRIQGEWVLFVDADDWLDKTCVEVVVESAEKNAVDIVLWDLIQHTETDNISEKPLKGKKRIFKGKELEYLRQIVLTFRSETGDDPLALIGTCCKLYRKDVLQQVVFPEELDLGEDTCFVIQALSYAGSLLYLNCFFYHRRLQGESLSQKRDMNYPERTERYANWMIRYCTDNEVVDTQILNDFLFSRLKGLAEHCFHVLPAKGQVRYYKKIRCFLENLDYPLDIMSAYEKDLKKKRLLAEGKYWRYKVYFVFQNVCQRIRSRK